MAEGGSPGQSARLADSGRCAASHRSSPQRKRSSSSRNGRGDGSAFARFFRVELGVASPLSDYSIGSIFGTAGSTRQAEQDDTLVLLFMCCHPSLTSSSAVALTLRAVGGLTTAEIARAFLVPESTMAQRVSRAKQTIKSSGVPFSLPTRAERAERLTAVLHVLYLIFNEGYTSSFGQVLQRTELSSEAIRLGRALHQLLPRRI